MIQMEVQEKVMYCMQNDNSFGKTNYRLDVIRLKMKQVRALLVTPIYMGPVKAIDADNMRISVVITDCGGKVMLVYMLVQAKLPAVELFEKTMNDSFGARLDAIYKWFIQQF